MNDPKPCKCGTMPILVSDHSTFRWICQAGCRAATPWLVSGTNARRVWNVMMETASGDFAASVKRWTVRRSGVVVGHVEAVPTTRFNRYVPGIGVANRDTPALESRVRLCNAADRLESNPSQEFVECNGFTLYRPESPVTQSATAGKQWPVTVDGMRVGHLSRDPQGRMNYVAEKPGPSAELVWQLIIAVGELERTGDRARWVYGFVVNNPDAGPDNSMDYCRR